MKLNHPLKNYITTFFSILLLFISLAGHAQKLTSESDFRNYFDTHLDSLDQLEGIWEVTTIQQFYTYDTLYDVIKHPKASKMAIIKNGDKFESTPLDGQPIDVQFSTSDVAGVYMYKNYYKETDSYSKASAAISKNGRMEFAYEFPEKYLRFKLEDSYEEGTRVMNNTSWVRIYPVKK